MTTYLAATEAVDTIKDEFDLWYAFILGFPGLVAAVLAFYGQQKSKKRWARQARQSDEIVFEVKNDHASNLRDDLDELKSLMQHGFRDTRQDISGLREELRTERLERIAGDQNRV